MKFNLCRLIVLGGCLSLLSGCGRIIDWGVDNVPQGESLEDYAATPKKYIRSIKMYDQFTTIGMFDALWLSDGVRTAYANSYCLKHGRSEDRRQAFLRRQLEENKHFITFYVLAPYDIELNEENTKWSLSLRIGDDFFSPVEIKETDLSPEYIAFFGKKFNRFRIAYQVKFDAQDVEDNSLLDTDVATMSLYFRSVEKEGIMSWPLRLNNLGINSNESLPSKN